MSLVIQLLPGQIGLVFGYNTNSDNQGGTIEPVAMPANGTMGQAFAIADPPGLNRGQRMLTWETRFDSAPSSITVNIQGSFDGVKWETLAVSTNVSGESGVVSPMDFPLVSAEVVTSSGGSKIAIVLKA